MMKLLTGFNHSLTFGHRRAFLGLVSLILPTLSIEAFGDESGQEDLCLMHVDEFSAESSDSPFYLHYHTLAIPVSALTLLPAAGVRVSTSPVDQGSYDVEGFNQFIEKTGLDPALLKAHSHEILISQSQLARIAKGEAKVEIRVISPSGNYVHNFLLTAPPSALVKVRKHLQGLAR